uniref:Uncharacterized protein n=1 Tax=Glossina pallidipes TaxID=7398 RepID=A0A1B0A2V7_GLOPL
MFSTKSVNNKRNLVYIDSSGKQLQLQCRVKENAMREGIMSCVQWPSATKDVVLSAMHMQSRMKRRDESVEANARNAHNFKFNHHSMIYMPYVHMYTCTHVHMYTCTDVHIFTSSSFMIIIKISLHVGINIGAGGHIGYIR